MGRDEKTLFKNNLPEHINSNPYLNCHFLTGCGLFQATPGQATNLLFYRRSFKQRLGFFTKNEKKLHNGKKVLTKKSFGIILIVESARIKTPNRV